MSFIEMWLFQQDAHGRAGSNPRYTAAARLAIYFASSVFFQLGLMRENCSKLPDTTKDL
jgi:hypothetical protein